MKALDKLKEIKIKEVVGKVKSYFLQGILLSGFFVILELVFHIMQNMEMSGRIIYPIGFSISLGFRNFSIIFIFILSDNFRLINYPPIS